MPSFKGVMHFVNDKQIINTDSIRSFSEVEADGQKATKIEFKNLPISSDNIMNGVTVKVDLDTVLTSYMRAMEYEDILVRVPDAKCFK